MQLTEEQQAKLTELSTELDLPEEVVALRLLRNANTIDLDAFSGHTNCMGGNNLKAGLFNSGVSEAKYTEFTEKYGGNILNINPDEINQESYSKFSNEK